MQLTLTRRERGFYQHDDNGLPVVTVFLSEEKADELGNPAKVMVRVLPITPGDPELAEELAE